MDTRLSARKLLEHRFPDCDFSCLVQWANGSTEWCAWAKADDPKRQGTRFYQVTVTLEGGGLSGQPGASRKPGRACEAKRPFNSEESAANFAAQMLRVHGWVQRVYLCPKCQKWHLATQTERHEKAEPLTQPEARQL